MKKDCYPFLGGPKMSICFKKHLFCGLILASGVHGDLSFKEFLKRVAVRKNTNIKRRFSVLHWAKRRFFRHYSKFMSSFKEV